MNEKEDHGSGFGDIVSSMTLTEIQLFELHAVRNQAPFRQISLDFGTGEIIWQARDMALSCCVPMEVRAINESGTEVVHIRARYLANYEFHHESTAKNEKGLNAFANINAPYNVFPFFRELVANQMTRMGLPAGFLPLIKPSEIGRQKIATPAPKAGSKRTGKGSRTKP